MDTVITFDSAYFKQLDIDDGDIIDTANSYTTNEDGVAVRSWKIKNISMATPTYKTCDETNHANILFITFKYYPILSILMLAPSIMSFTLMLAYWCFNATTIHPAILIWLFIGFGGMYIVLTSAAREINAEKTKQN